MIERKKIASTKGLALVIGRIEKTKVFVTKSKSILHYAYQVETKSINLERRKINVKIAGRYPRSEVSPSQAVTQSSVGGEGTVNSARFGINTLESLDPHRSTILLHTTNVYVPTMRVRIHKICLNE